VTAVFGSPALASVIGSKVRGGAPKQIPLQCLDPQQQQQKRLDPIQAKARELAVRELRVKELEIANREKQLGLGQPVAAAAAPTTAEPAAVAEETAADPMDTQVSPEEVTSIQNKAEADGQEVKLPSNIADSINSYTAAQNDGDIVETTIEMLFSWQDEKWKPFAEIIVGNILQSNRSKFLSYMASFFVSLRTINLMEDEMARKIMKVLHDNFEIMVSAVQEHVRSSNEGEQDGVEDGAADESGDENGEEGEEDEDPEDLLQLNQ
jgi:hypothetical protein